MILELPGAALLGARLIANPGLALMNRHPAPDEDSVLVDASISLDIASSTGSAPDASSTTVLIDGAPAFSGGAFQPGFQGPGSSAGAVDAQTLRIVIDPEASFETLALIAVRVISQDLAASATLDETYAFTIQDLVPPSLSSAEALGPTEVRATFNEPMRADSSAGGTLNVTAWSLTPIDLPAVSPAPVEIRPETSTSFMLVFPEELSFGRRYQLVVEGVEDLAGNALIIGTADFISAMCPERPPDREFELLRFLPATVRDADQTGDQAAMIAIAQEIVDLILCDIDQFHRRVVDPETADEQFVDAMLRDMGNPFSFEELELVNRRRLLLSLFGMYKLKGTAPGIVAAVLFFLGIEVQIDVFAEERWRLGEDELGVDTILNTDVPRLLYSFRIISPVALTVEERKRILRIGQYMKCAHEHLVDIVEPFVDEVDHWELGLSELGELSLLH